MATLLRKLRSLLRMDGVDRRRALRAMVTLWKVSRMLRKTGLQRCQERLLERLQNALPLSSKDPEDSKDLIVSWDWAVRLASRNVPVRARCLEQSVTLWYLLARHDVASELRIGVRKPRPDAVEAHAWVEVDGHPVNDRPDIAQTYAVFDGPLPASAQVR